MIVTPFKLQFERSRRRYWTETFWILKLNYLAVPIFAIAYTFLTSGVLWPGDVWKRLVLAGTLGLLLHCFLLLRFRRQFLTLTMAYFSDPNVPTTLSKSQAVLNELFEFPKRMIRREWTSFLLCIVLPVGFLIYDYPSIGTGLLIAAGMGAIWNYLLSERWTAAPIFWLKDRVKGLKIPDRSSYRPSKRYVTLAVVSVAAVLACVFDVMGQAEMTNWSPAAAKTVVSDLFFKLTGAIAWIAICASTLAWLISRSLDMVFRELSDAIRSLEQGDFNVTASLSAPHGIGFLNIQLDSAIQKIRDRIAYLQKNGLEMYSTTNLIASLSSNQNQSLVRQSSSLSQTSSTLEEMVRSANQISDHASSVVKLAEDTESLARHGLERMTATVTKINDVESKNQAGVAEVITLTEKFQEIEAILKFIRAVADETNLIAINATIEASSAGEQGSRFKVVAREVRDLSDRVTHSVKNIQAMIESIDNAASRLVTVAQETSEHTSESVRLAQTSLESFREILDWAKKSSDAAKQIYIAINQQRLANKQISLSFGDISGDMKSLAASSERYAETVDALKKFSSNMEAVIQYFVKQQPPAKAS